MIDTGNTAWLLTATALVLFMTLPGLALFYGGLVRADNLLSVLMQCFAITCLVSVLWLAGAYSLTFSGTGPWLGDLDKALLRGITREAAGPNTTVPETVFFMFQMTFAIITPGADHRRLCRAHELRRRAAVHRALAFPRLCARGALDLGRRLARRRAACSISLADLWCISPLAYRLCARHHDWAARGLPRGRQPPHAPWMTMAGACMLWVGWFGFNAGSALKAGGDAGMAMTVTHISAATAALVWLVIEWREIRQAEHDRHRHRRGRWSCHHYARFRLCRTRGALVIGLAGGTICYLMVGLVKRRLKIDDSLDVFAVHGVGGATGVLLTAIFADAALGGIGLAEGRDMGGQFVIQTHRSYRRHFAMVARG